MKVIALRIFNDLKAKKIRSVGEKFEVTEERFAEIMAADEENPFVEKVETKIRKATKEVDE